MRQAYSLKHNSKLTHYRIMVRCPKCSEVVINVTLQQLPVFSVVGESPVAVAYSCPHCHAMLGIAPDPAVTRVEIAEEVAKRTKQPSGR